MTLKPVAFGILATMLAVAPMSGAEAHGHGWGHHEWGIFGLGAAVVAGTAAVLSAPFYAIGEAAGPAPAPYYPPQQMAYAPPPPAYYAQPAYAPAPVYYAQPAPVYYGRPYYGRRYYY